MTVKAHSTSHITLTSTSLFHSFISLFSVYPHTGKTKDVEMVIGRFHPFIGHEGP